MILENLVCILVNGAKLTAQAKLKLFEGINLTDQNRQASDWGELTAQAKLKLTLSSRVSTGRIWLLRKYQHRSSPTYAINSTQTISLVLPALMPWRGIHTWRLENSIHKFFSSIKSNFWIHSHLWNKQRGLSFSFGLILDIESRYSTRSRQTFESALI